ncbi:MAG: DoxX family protein [Acidimicrobiia bacterium]
MEDPVSSGLLVLRIGLGVVFLAHGVKHLMGREKTTNWFGWLGFKAPGFQWFASTATELGVGVLLIVGALTGFAAAGVVGVMAVAFWTVHRKAGFFITAFMQDDVDVEGYEYVAVLALAATAIAITGPGVYSIDDKVVIDGVSVASQLDGWVGLALAGVGAVLAGLLLAVFWRPGQSRQS